MLRLRWVSMPEQPGFKVLTNSGIKCKRKAYKRCTLNPNASDLLSSRCDETSSIDHKNKLKCFK